MIKPSSFISALTLVTFIQCHVMGVWASPVPHEEQDVATASLSFSTLYLGKDPYSQASLRLQYDAENKALEWQLLNNGYVFSSQSHALPEDTLTVDTGLVFQGDQIVVAGRTTNGHWFIRAQNSQGEFQWQRKGEGWVDDLAFSDDGQTLYAVGAIKNKPALFEVNAQSGFIGFNSAISAVESGIPGNDDAGSRYKQIVVVGHEEVVVAQHWESDGQLKFIKWQVEVQSETDEALWQIVPGFCPNCDRAGIQSVALKHERKQQLFYSIASDGSQLEFSIKNITNGENLLTQMVSVESGSGVWSGVSRGDIDAESVHNLSTGTADQPVMALQSGSKLQFFSAGCRLLLNGQAFGGKTLGINICGDHSGTGAGRRLLQAENSTELSEDPNRDFPHPEGQANRVIVEWIGGIIGILGGATLITGVLFYFKNLWDTRQEKIKHAREEEEVRRVKESERLESSYDYYLDSYKPTFYSGDTGSTIFLAPIFHAKQDTKQLLSEKRELEISQSAPELQSEFIEIKNTQHEIEFVRHIINGDLKQVDTALDDDSSLAIMSDSKTGHTLLHMLADLPKESLKPMHTSIANLLLKNGADFGVRANSGLTALELAALRDKVELLKLLLTWKPFITFEEASSLFHIAVKSNNEMILSALLQRECDEVSGVRFTPKKYMWCCCRAIDARSVQDYRGSTLLHEAVLSGNKNIVKLLLDKDIVPADAVDDNGLTALHIAVINKKTEMVKELLENSAVRAHVDEKDNDGNTALHRAAQQKGSGEIIDSLREHSNKREKNKQNRTALDLACEHDNHEYIEHLSTSSWLQPKLHRGTLRFMARNGYFQSIHALGRRYFSEVNKSDDGEMDLKTALEENQFEAAYELIQKGADYSEYKSYKPRVGRLPVLLRNINHEVIEFFVHNDLMVFSEVSDDEGNTVFHWAAARGFYKIFYKYTGKVLSNIINAVNREGDTPLHIAIRKGKHSIVQILLQNSADPNKKNNEGDTPLHIAIISVDDYSLKLLVENTIMNLDFEIVNNLKETALDIARKKGHSALVNQLKRLGAVDRGVELSSLDTRQNTIQTQVEIHPKTTELASPEPPERAESDTGNESPYQEARKLGDLQTQASLEQGTSSVTQESSMAPLEVLSMTGNQPSFPDALSETHSTLDGAGSPGHVAIPMAPAVNEGDQPLEKTEESAM